MTKLNDSRAGIFAAGTPITTAAALLRFDLVRQYWVTYAVVATATLLAHAVWVAFIGLSTSTDFAVRYDPGARELLAWLSPEGNAGDAPVAAGLGAYGWSRLGYILFVAACYLVWGVGNWVALIYTQLSLVWLVYPLVFHMLLHLTGRYTLSVIAIGVWLSFYDGYQWQFWALPDALYRLIFTAAFFVLLRLYETGKQAALPGATLFAIGAGTLFRIETILYALPALLPGFHVLRRTHPRILMLGLVSSVVLVLWGRAFFETLIQLFVGFQSRGLVFTGLGYDVPGVTVLRAPTDQSSGSWLLFLARLFLMRLWYSITPFPAFWSSTHQMYYAVYLLPAYVLTAFGAVSAIRRRDWTFLACLWVFLAGIVLRVLVHVDPPLRYAYTPQVFHFICAVLGWPAFREAATNLWRQSSAVRTASAT